uniref:Uncharacterized protein n=1 Tax=Oryza punctata TaxID=4537 RepID=A0A0E0MLE8_ORYPU
MARWSDDGRCVGWLCGVLIGNRWRKPCQAIGRLDDDDAIRRHSPTWKHNYDADPSSTKNLSRAKGAISGLLQRLRSSMGLGGATKLGNDDILQSLYRVVGAICM